MIQHYATTNEFHLLIEDATRLANELQRFADCNDPDYKDDDLSQASLQMHTVRGLLKRIEHDKTAVLP